MCRLHYHLLVSNSFKIRLFDICRYCECFEALRYCDNCNCVDCFNIVKYNDARVEAIKLVKEKNHHAFQVKIVEEVN